MQEINKFIKRKTQFYNMNKKLMIFLAVPAILVLALGIIFFINQPKVNPVPSYEKTVKVNGDEYPLEEYLMDEAPLNQITNQKPKDFNYFIPVKLSDCLTRPIETRDNCYFTYTALSGDPKGCFNINDPTDRSDCFMGIAQLTGEKSYCENVKWGVSQCYVDVAINTGDASLCTWGDYEARQCYEAYKTKNPNNCAEGYDRRLCIQAIFDNNSELCNNIRTLNNYCYYSVATDTNSPSLCNKIKIPQIKENCFFEIALKTNNPEICENLEEVRDNCIAWIAYNTGNKQLCYKAGKEAQSCIEDVEDSSPI